MLRRLCLPVSGQSCHAGPGHLANVGISLSVERVLGPRDGGGSIDFVTFGRLDAPGVNVPMPREEESNTGSSFAELRRDIAGIPVNELVRSFSTPLYVYDSARIVERIEDLRAFDVIRYAQKACSNTAVLALCRSRGVVVDATSAGEIRRAKRAGYADGEGCEDIVYTADIFDRVSLDMVTTTGVRVNCGSPDMIRQYGERCPGREITVRLNPGFGHGHSRKTNTGGEQSKHGIWHEHLDECLEAARSYGLRVSGVHVHIGSGSDMEHLSQVCGAVESLAQQVGGQVSLISAGGGLPIVYREGDEALDLAVYFSLWDATRKRLEKEFGHTVSLEIEPGRYLTGESGYLIAEVRAVKRMGSNLFYLLDAGFNDLARPILYGAYHPMSVAAAAGSGEARRVRAVVVGGPLCESGDIFTQDAGGFVRTQELPEAEVGDFVVIECAGAYGSVMASNYNSKPLAAEVLIHDGRPHLIRKRQSLEDLTALETLPDFLC